MKLLMLIVLVALTEVAHLDYRAARQILALNIEMPCQTIYHEALTRRMGEEA